MTMFILGSLESAYMVDFPLVLIELFALGVRPTAEASENGSKISDFTPTRSV